MAPPVAAAAAPSIMSAIAPALIGGAFGMLGSKSQNKENQAASAKQMEFQERMSSSAYQRGMADMKKAGLNPILAYSKGGASTPGGSTYQAQNIGSAATAGAQTAAMASNTISQAEISRNNAKMSALDLGAFQRSGFGPQFANSSSINQTMGQQLKRIIGQLGSNSTSFKENLDKVKKDPNSSYNKFKNKQNNRNTKTGASRTDEPLRILIQPKKYRRN